AKNRVLLKYRYQNLSDHVAVADMEDYVSEWDLAEKGMGFGLSDDFGGTTADGGKKETNSSTGFTVAYVILSILVLVTYLYRRMVSRRSFYE
ncbi:MAG TPA: hypothetical protein VM871_10475, partial [Flavisolibacter sp.]|nr:hypothetical protein [Flavisolibacter sp.]